MLGVLSFTETVVAWRMPSGGNWPGHKIFLTLGTLGLLLGSAVAVVGRMGSSQAKQEAPAEPQSKEEDLAKMTVGGGCFWCIEGVLSRVRGVHSVIPGYAGGRTRNPSYDSVCSGTTGHAEVVQVTYDQTRVSFETLLQVFFKSHDPTQLNRQGHDVGTQYRSVVFYHDDEQKAIATTVRDKLNDSGAYRSKIVTEISPLDVFYPAENYHHKYYDKNPSEVRDRKCD